MTQSQVTTGEKSPGGEPSIRLSANLSGPNAQWAGVVLPVSAPSIPAGADSIILQARPIDGGPSLDVGITDADGDTWVANAPLQPGWNTVSIPLVNFALPWDSPRRDKPFITPGRITSLSPRIRRGAIGDASLDVVAPRLADVVPDFTIKWAPITTCALQRKTIIDLETVATTSGLTVPYNGDIFVDVLDRATINLPERVTFAAGRGRLEFFPRAPGPLTIFFFDPANQREQPLNIDVEQRGLRVEFLFDHKGPSPVYLVNDLAHPSIKLEGEITSAPLSCHVEVRDHNKRLVLSRNFSVAELSAFTGKTAFSTPGELTAEVRVLADPIADLPRAPDPLPEPVGFTPSALTTTTATFLPDGVTTAFVAGSLLKFEQLPTTATVLAYDTFTVWAVPVSPRENILYGAPFGIAAGPTAGLSAGDALGVINKRNYWHRRIGSFWGRELFSFDGLTTTGEYDWARFEDIVSAYRNVKIRLSAQLAMTAPADRQSSPYPASELFRAWVSEIARRMDTRITTYEILPVAADGSTSAPRPFGSLEAYRQILRDAQEAVRQSSPIPRIAASLPEISDLPCATALLAGDFSEVLDIVGARAWPRRPSENPAANNLDYMCKNFLETLRTQNMIRRGKEWWITETGWPTGPGGISELDQANYLVRAYTAGIFHGATKVFWNTLQDDSRLPWRGPLASRTGLMDSNFRPKPSLGAYAFLDFMMTHLDGREITRQGPATIYSFEIRQHSTKWPGTLHLAWTEKRGEETTVTLPMTAGAVLAQDFLGGQHDFETVSGDPGTTRTCLFGVSYEPLYIWDMGLGPR
ncbi:MAG: hypothetical protein K1X53_06750 [Candidatus Sumerlaeaceae bacterium]|nr:hypothetical protein [Candidatus Sumerlaeaceae bacterium]